MFTIFTNFFLLILNAFTFKEKVLESQIIQLNHQLRSIKTSRSENHCVTFSPDGSYNIYEFDDDGQWKRMVLVNCSRWQVGGLIATQTDANAQNILTLSHQGNFMCTSFKYILQWKKFKLNTWYIIYNDEFQRNF